MKDELENGVFVGEHTHCIVDEFPITPWGVKRKPCGSSDALACYEKEEESGVSYDALCWSCHQVFTKEEVHNSSVAGFLGIEGGVVVERKKFENKATKKDPITREERNELWSRTGWEANGYRELTDEMLQFYGHRTELDDKGNVIAQYYPETVNGSLVGYKSKHNPKNWGKGVVGKTGVSSDLSGQHKFPNGGKYCLVVGGEDDKVAAQVMLREHQRSKGQEGYDPICVVSPTTGEPSAPKQCQAQYSWFDENFEVIIIGMDSDTAGDKATDAIIKVLPKDKVRIATWSENDPNKMLIEGKQKQFLSNFYGAKPVIDAGVYDANNDMTAEVIEVLTTPRISLPPFAAELQNMTKGTGLFTRSIYSLIGDTSVGKSTYIDAFIYHWMFNLKHHKVGIVSLEASKGEWVAGMLSTYLEKNLWWMPPEEVADYLAQPEIAEKLKNFYYNEYGEARYTIVDDREGTIESLQDCIEKQHRQYGCNIIVNDVLTDILRVYDNEAQARHFNWQSNFVKSGPTIFNVLHTRKPPSDRKGRPTSPDEFDTYGNSIFVQKSAGNIIIARNKQAPNGDVIEQNTTYPSVPKLRKGETGTPAPWYYDGATRQMYDRNQYFKDNPDKLPAGYDLTVSSFDKAYWEEGGRGYDGSASTSSSTNFKKKSNKPVTDVAPIVVDGVTF